MRVNISRLDGNSSVIADRLDFKSRIRFHKKFYYVVAYLRYKKITEINVGDISGIEEWSD